MLQSGAGVSMDIAAIGDEDSGVREGGGNRWPKEETLALLQIRSDMDAVFRDSSLKGPLWEEVSRKMAEMGFRRSAKKCREKFENVYKYHKRTKDTRASKGPDKTYRFFDQLKALESTAQSSSSSFHHPGGTTGSPPIESAVPIAMAMPPPRPPAPQPPITTAQVQQPFQLVMPVIQQVPSVPPAAQRSGSPSSSSTSSDEGVARTRRRRKWKGFFDRLTKDVMEKQEELQRKFLEGLEKRENDRRVREEAWKAQEIARLKQEHEIIVQERSMAAAKDAALMTFLQKLSDHQQVPLPPAILQRSQPPEQLLREKTILHPPPPPPQATLPTTQTPETVTIPVASPPPVNYNAVGSSSSASSSRWPKTEVEALINLRKDMDQKYQDGGPKGPLWEDISAAMRRMGFDRSAKRCKEKWENINKYFKKVKDNEKKRRRDDSKTCPYYDQLEAIHRAKIPHTPATAPMIPQPPPPADRGSGNDDEFYEDEDDEDQPDR